MNINVHSYGHIVLTRRKNIFDVQATVKLPCGHLPFIFFLTEVCEIQSQERSTVQRAFCYGASMFYNHSSSSVYRNP